MRQNLATQSAGLSEKLPPHAFFVVSALFHYLGPSFAVLLFAHVEPLGVAWLRIASAALIFALWRPWRVLRRLEGRTVLLIAALGAALAAMNAAFYLAIDRLPLATVAAIEFVAVLAIALAGVRSLRNFVALALALAGVYALIGFQSSNDWLGLAFTALNAALFALYIVLGHASSRAGAAPIDRLGAAMIVALVVAMPVGIAEALVAFASPALLLAGLGIGVSSSVIPYVCDQLAMARLPRATFALMLAMLPAVAAIVGAVVLRQVPSPVEAAGIALVAVGIGLHRPN
ncbi:MAG TPA: EamA family transporter [Propylenella sp.]|nr:EamA family transporter [Propylenella sp.]